MDTIQHKGGFRSIYYGYNGPVKPIQESPNASTSIIANQKDQTTRVYGGCKCNI